jgi:hypothetical protein
VVRAEALSSPASGAAEDRCRSCGSELREDQEWCLDCGAARTVLRSPPDWRLTVTIVVAVLIVLIAGVVVALVSLAS